jgi:hypothetical protein
MLRTEGRSLFLIDIPDFSPSGDEPKNHSYSPEYIDNCTSFERDNYAVMKMSCELLGLSWGMNQTFTQRLRMPSGLNWKILFWV